jgi:hypothetical protein
MNEEKAPTFEELAKKLPVKWIKFQIEKSKQEIKNYEAGIRFLERMLKEKEKQDD